MGKELVEKVAGELANQAGYEDYQAVSKYYTSQAEAIIPLITHARDLEWMNRLLDAGIPVMDDPKDVPENLYTQAYLDHEKKAAVEEIKRELELHFTSSLPTEGCFSDIGIYAKRDKWHKFWKDMGCK